MIKTIISFVIGLLISLNSYAGELDFLQPFDALLKNHVRHITIKGMETAAVNYYAWQADSRHIQAMDMLKAANPENISSDEEKLSFWINAYNLLTIELILQENETKDIRNLGGTFSANPWRKFKWRIGKKKYNLNEIEKKILRPMKEPRIYFALCKSSISSPDLKKGVYWPKKIYSQLDEQVKKFIANHRKGMYIEKSKYAFKPDIVHVSTIFKRHRAEFARGNLQRYISRYQPIKKGAKIVADIEFVWDLNAIPGRVVHAE